MRGWVFAAAALACLALRGLLAGRQFDATGLLFALAPFNAAAFSLRRRLAWTRGPVTHGNEPKAGLFRDAPMLARRERQLRKRYDLERLRDGSTVHAYRENLYVLDVLDHVTLPRGERVRAVDVGSQDFRYAFGIARWLGRFGRTVELTGIELEGHHVYADLHSRKEHAEAFASEVDHADVRYVVGDFTACEPCGTDPTAKLDVITFFFPFVLEYALVRWGLPRRFFEPRRIFDHAFSLLKPGGTVVVMNHTEAERVRQVELLEACGFMVESSAAAKSELVDYAADVPERSLTIARRPA